MLGRSLEMSKSPDFQSAYEYYSGRITDLERKSTASELKNLEGVRAACRSILLDRSKSAREMMSQMDKVLAVKFSPAEVAKSSDAAVASRQASLEALASALDEYLTVAQDLKHEPATESVDELVVELHTAIRNATIALNDVEDRLVRHSLRFARARLILPFARTRARAHAFIERIVMLYKQTARLECVQSGCAGWAVDGCVDR